MLKILFIGNSFSEDTTAYLEKVAEGELFVRNLYIGGCSLEMHANNIKENKPAYAYQKDAAGIEHVSINDALHFDAWDIISVQQVSGLSGIPDSYEPYLEFVLGYVREQCPKAKIVFHRTWSYEMGSAHGDFPRYNCDPDLMFSRIIEASTAAAERYGLDIIPVGNAIELARLIPRFTHGAKDSMHRDGFHLSLTFGRYLAALTACAYFTRKSVKGVKFAPEGVDEEAARLLKIIADTVVL